MWYALTAKPVPRSKREIKKEFFTASYEIIVSAESESLLNLKITDSLIKYPEQTKKYLKAGIKIIEADNPSQAKQKAKNSNIYFDQSGQYNLF